jgi:hypothetical protein
MKQQNVQDNPDTNHMSDAKQGDQGPMLWFLKYFRQKTGDFDWKIMQKTPFFRRKNVENRSKLWSYHAVVKKSHKKKPKTYFSKFYSVTFSVKTIVIKLCKLDKIVQR